MIRRPPRSTLFPYTNALPIWQMLVDNYSVFYIVGENTVSVARVLYSASDLVRRLRRMK